MEYMVSYERDNPTRGKYPLHEIGQMSCHPIELRLAWAETVIAAGNDPNELDLSKPASSLDRPLHCLVDNDAPPANLQLVRFLLDHGADPRLRDVRNRLSPMHLARFWIEGARGSQQKYFQDVLKMMETAAKKLDDQEAIERGEIPGGVLGRAKWYLGFGPQLPEKAPKKVAEMREKPQVYCLLCKEEWIHEWHLYCYAGTIKECREVPRDHTRGKLLQPVEPTGYLADFRGLEY